MSSERTLWGIHAGRLGEADSLFLRKKVIAVGWHEMGDVSKIGNDREALKAKIADTYPKAKPGAIPVHAGQLFRFINEVKIGDFVVYPSKIDRHIYIGRVKSDHRYDTSVSTDYPNVRDVEWVDEYPRTLFTQGALYEIGSALTLFQVKNYADEFIAAGEGVPPTPVDEGPELEMEADEIKARTRDFILKQLAREAKGHPMEHFVAHLLEAMGYKTRVAPMGTDAGIDIIAHKDDLGFEPPIIKVQVKSTEGSVGDPIVSALYGKVDNGEFGLLVTLGTFSNQAKSFARNKSNLRLIDGQELVDLIFEYYESFDSKYKDLLPLKQVYVPEPIAGNGSEG